MQGNNPYPPTSRSAEFAAAHDRQDRERKSVRIGTADMREEIAFLQASVDSGRGTPIVVSRIAHLREWVRNIEGSREAT